MATEPVQRFPKGARVSIFFTPEMVGQLPLQLRVVAKDHPGYLFDYEDDGHALVILEGLRGAILRVPEGCVTRLGVPDGR